MLIREAVRVPAAGWDTLNYLHGPMESQDAKTGLIAIGDGREVKIARDVAAFGCPSVLVTSRTDVSPGDRLAVISMPASAMPSPTPSWTSSPSSSSSATCRMRPG